MTAEEWKKVNEYITRLHEREKEMVYHIDNQNYGLAKQVFFQEIEPLIVNVEE